MNISALYEHFKACPAVCTDTRKITPNCLFFALKGENFDGNKFAPQALEAGASLAIVDDANVATDDHFFLVEDVLTCLQALARHHRQTLNTPIVGITGSNGKTTTKELIREVLAAKYNIHATTGNFNNHIGVPLTLLELKAETEIAIIEMGANHLGEIGELCAISLPDHGIITNIGKAHIEGFGSFEGVKKTKNELYQAIPSDNPERLLFVNADDDLLMGLASEHPKKTYGTNEGEVRGKIERADPLVSFSWKADEYSSDTIETQLIGTYNLPNMLAAVCIGRHFAVPEEDINRALANYRPSNNRSQIERTEKNTLILDAYNANPTSMAAALENFAAIDVQGKYFILGDMLELGPDSVEEHRKIVAMAESLGLTNGIFVGGEFMKAAPTSHPVFAKTDEAITFLEQSALRTQFILVKGSRGIRLESTVAVL